MAVFQGLFQRFCSRNTRSEKLRTYLTKAISNSCASVPSVPELSRTSVPPPYRGEHSGTVERNKKAKRLLFTSRSDASVSLKNACFYLHRVVTSHNLWREKRLQLSKMSQECHISNQKPPKTEWPHPPSIPPLPPGRIAATVIACIGSPPSAWRPFLGLLRATCGEISANEGMCRPLVGKAPEVQNA
jgi:hypothetical protein